MLQRGESLSVSNMEPYNARLATGGLEARCVCVCGVVVVCVAWCVR